MTKLESRLYSLPVFQFITCMDVTYQRTIEGHIASLLDGVAERHRKWVDDS